MTYPKRRSSSLLKTGVYLFLLFISFMSHAFNAIAKDASGDIKLDTSSLTLSGLSSGGYMATQFHLAYPEMVLGTGIIAAGPYGCARNSIMTALSECVNKAPQAYPDNLLDMSPFVANQANQFKDDKVWILHGTLDTTINASVSDALYVQYQQLISQGNLRYINDKPFAHLFPTMNSGTNCDESVSPFIGNCGYDAAGAMLSFIMGSLQPPVSLDGSAQTGELIAIKQTELADLDDTGMSENGFVFVPNSCRDGNTCKLHISFHGCNQSVEQINSQYASNTGINEWAASNRIVVLYPQTAKSTLMPMNPQACWDWWGYTDDNYLNKNGKQINAVRQMALSLADYLKQ